MNLIIQTKMNLASEGPISLILFAILGVTVLLFIADTVFNHLNKNKNVK
ncbi:MAG: hypothetical protein WBG30_00175 [Psychrilyobacter sp.]